MKIQEVTIEGYQSHTNSTFRLSPGLTVITGPSDAGKTAIIRALRWFAFNEPTGEAFLHTIRNPDGSVTLLINGRYIRGFISPKYTDNTVTPVTPAAGKDLTTVAREVILGVWGNMPERKTKLEASGYNFTDVQNKVNELLNKNVPTPSKPQNTGVTKVVAGSGAASFNKALAGSYVTTTGLYMRHGAGKNKRAMVLIPEGTKVQNYGYYTSYNGTKWLYIQVTLNGVQYTGFSSKTYLKKQ